MPSDTAGSGSKMFALSAIYEYWEEREHENLD